MSRKTICIGIPCFGGFDYQVGEDYMRLMYHLGRRHPEYDFQLAIKGKSEQFRARNAIVKAALQNGADYIWMLDDDHILNIEKSQGQSNAYDLPIKLIKHLEGNDKIGVVGALYFQRGGDCYPVFMQEKNGLPYFLHHSEIAGQMQRVDVTGGGCMMIRTSVFDKIEEPWFKPEHEFGTDVQLCKQVRGAGFEVWIDTSLEIGHLQSERDIVSSKNVKEKITTIPVDDGLHFSPDEIIGSLFKDVLEYTGYKDIDEIVRAGNSFMEKAEDEWKGTSDWYLKYPKERVARQLAFLTQSQHKQDLMKSVLSSINSTKSYKVLDFGCGIGVLGYELAKKGLDVHCMDIKDTGTFEFLKWRAKKNNVKITFIDSPGGVPALGGFNYDIIIAMDSIEHIEDWKRVVSELVRHTEDSGVIFSNNGILDDQGHPEHYLLKPKEFVKEMVVNDMQPLNQITYLK